MLVAIADIQLKNGLGSDFMEWFSESNKLLSKFDGFVSRQLLRSDDEKYRIIVEHRNKQTFEAMHRS
jgi:heme-degrading monooxygenase HmoA